MVRNKSLDYLSFNDYNALKMVTPYLLTFLTSFVQIFLITFQTIIITKMNVLPFAELMIFITSISIALCWLINVNSCVRDNNLFKACYILGSGFGAACGPKFQQLL